jgi:hypothetical protein
MYLKVMAFCRYGRMKDMTSLLQAQAEQTHLQLRGMVPPSQWRGKLRKGLLPDVSIRSAVKPSHLVDNDNKPSQALRVAQRVGGEYDDLVVNLAVADCHG